jgi:fibronectin-binding autotransporter adhesin
LCGVSAAAIVLGVATPAAAQQTVYWDANGSLPGSGGNGNWDITSPLWSQSNNDVLGPYQAWVNNAGNPNDAVFGTQAGTSPTVGTITLTTPINAHNLTFQSVNGWNLQGGTLTLGGANPTITTSTTATIGSVIAGTSGLVKAGNSNLTLSGNNTFSGGITINAGTLIANNDAALGALGNNITTAASTTVGFQLLNGTTSRTLTIGNGGTVALNGAGAGSALITGSGNVDVGLGVVMSNDASNYTGSTTIHGCNGVCTTSFTSIGNVGQASSLGAGDTITWNQTSQYGDYLIYLGDGDSSNRSWIFNSGSGGIFRNQGTGTLSLSGGIAVTGSAQFLGETADILLSGVISGNASLLYSGLSGHSVTVTGMNTYTGASTIAGLVNVPIITNAGAAGPLGTSSAVSLTNGGTLNFTGSGSSSDRTWTSDGLTSIANSGTGALTLSGSLSFVAGGTDTLTFGGNYAGTNTFSGVISGTGNLASSGTTTWLLSAANTRSGAVTVNGGTLQAGNASAFGTTTGVTVNGGTLDLNGFTLITPTLNGTGGNVALGSATLTVNGTTNSTYGGVISGSGSLSKLGTGILTLTGTNSYTGTTNIGGGTLKLDFSPAGGTTSNIISGSSPLNMAGGTLQVVGANGEADTQTFNGLNVAIGSNTVTATSGTGGSMTLNLGAITRSGGVVNFNLPTAGAITTTNSSLGGWATVNGSDYAKVVGGNITAFTAADYTNEDNAANWNTDGQFISDAGGAANSPYFGTVDNNVQLAGLKYTAAANSTIAIGAGNTLGVDGTIIVSSTVGNTNQVINGPGNLTGPTGGGPLAVLNNSGTFVIGAKIVDNGGSVGLVKAGAGTLNLTNANTYTGATTLSGGTLWIGTIADGGVASTLGASSNVASNLVLESGRLLYTGNTATTDRGLTLVNGGPSRTIEVSNAGANLTFTGLVTSPDDASLTKAGAGTLTLANDTNDYIGATNVTAGILSVDTLANGGVVSGIGKSSSASANLILQTGGVLQYTGGTVSSNRGFTLASGSGGIDVSNAGTTLTVSGVGVGTGSLVKTGAGTLILSGTNSYSGGTTVNAGTLRAGSVQAFGIPNGAMTVNAGGTLDINSLAGVQIGALSGDGNVTLGSATLTIGGNNSTAIGFTGTINGTGGVTHTNGTQVMTGCNNSYTGATTITAAFGGSVLNTDCIKDGGVNSGIGASTNDPANLVIRDSGLLEYSGATQTTNRGFTLASSFGYIQVDNAATTLTFTGDVVGSGHVIKRGAGTLVLSGNNTFTGQTRVEAGSLVAGSAGAFDQGTDGLIMSDVAGAAFDANGFNTSFLYLFGGGATGGNIALGSGTLTITNGANQIYAGAISGTGNLVKAGAAGGQILSGCNSSYTGTTTVSSGALQVDCLANGLQNSSIGASSNAAGNLIINGGTFRYSGAGSTTDRLFTLGASAASKIESSGTGAVVFTNNGPIAFQTANTTQTIRIGGTNTDDNKLGARITDNGTGKTSLTKEDAGTWILTNPGSTYTGATTIVGGVLGVDKLANGGTASSIGMSSSAAMNLVIGSGATLRYTGTGDTTDRQFTVGTGTTAIESSGTGAVLFSNTGAVSYAGSGTRVVSLGGTYTGDNIMGAAIGNQSAANFTSLAKNGAGKWILTGNNTYTGNTNINAGTLVVGNGGTTGSIASTIVNIASGGVLGFNRSDTVTYAGTIQDALVGAAGQVQQLGTGKTILTGSNSFTGGTTIAQGTLQLGNGGTTGSIVGNVADNGTLSFNRSNGYQFDGTISGTGRVTQDGTGTTTLTADNSYSGGTTISAGTLQVGNGGTTGAIGTGDVVDNGALIFNRSNNLLFGGLISGSGTLTKLGAGILTLTGNNSYTGLTTISAGALQIGNGGTNGSVAGNIVNNASLIFNRSNTLGYGGQISGSGSVDQIGAGTTILTSNNSYTGATSISAGTLLINGNQSGATGTTNVLGGGTLGGTGTIGGDVFVGGGAVLAPGSNGVGTLTINGNLGLSPNATLNMEFGAANSVGNPLNDLINVGGNLTLDGTINVTVPTGGSFGAGIYRVINYSGTLTNNGLNIGTMPIGSSVFVQTAVAGQVNLVNTANLTLNFWDGAAGPKFDGAVNGGNGVWQNNLGNDNWTDASGVVNAPYADGAIAIFTAAPGTVTVDNSLGAVTTAGMQFASDGYVLTGDPLTLTGATAEIRVGDASAAGAGYTATINNALAGSSQLVKTDLGTLVLNGGNTYTGGTAINGGTLQISTDGSLGAAAGGLSLNGGTLHTTADVSSSRSVALTGNGTFLADGATTLSLTGTVSGAGALTKSGTGTLVLAGNDSYAGGTTISAGRLELGNGGTSGSIVGNVANSGVLGFSRSDTSTFAGVISGSGSVDQMGSGTTILTGANSYAGGTTISSGTLQLGDGGTSGSIVGNVANAGTLAFNRSDDITFAGVISGSGGVNQDGTGTLTLIGTSTYAGSTNVNSGILLVNGDLSGALGTVNVLSGATLGGIGTIGGNAAVNGTLAAGSNGIGVLTINGALSLGSGSALDMEFGQANTPGGPLNDLVNVGGDLTLDGTINVAVAAGGSFDVGLYRVINYGGALINNGLDIGTMPAGSSVVVQTSVAGQVNLVNSAGLTLNIWDGAAGPKDDGAVNGGDGSWHLSGSDRDWTNVDGAINAAYADGSFAIFSATSGTVTVDNSQGAVTTSGMQFASDGYVIDGDPLRIVGSQAIVRVGDGTLAGGTFDATIAADLIGTSELVKTDLGTLILTGSNSYAGGTTIAEGTLQIGNGGSSGSIVGDIVNNAALTFNRSDEMTFGGAISGSGGVSQIGGGTLILTGASSYTGQTNVSSGTLLVNGDQSAASGLTNVASGATLGGIGTIGGNVSVADGGALAPGSDGVGTLTINGDLSLGSGSNLSMEFGQANTVGGSLNDLINVGGDLVLDGTLNVSVPSGGALGPGIYRVINYGGTLTDNGLSLGVMPAGSDATVQTSIAGQVNLLNTGNVTLNFWDGAAGPKFNNAVNGGDGVWQNSAGNNDWTDSTGAVNAPFSDASFAVFSATPGTVTIDNSLGAVTAAGMQFASDGYVITGGDLTLVGPQSTIRVGDGSVAGASFSATINSKIVGATQLVKTDAGTLILSGANGYSGGTAINGGTLQIASDSNLGDAAGEVSFNGGALATTADMTSGRDMAFVGAGTISTASGTTFTYDGLLSGGGAVTKSGAGSWIVTANSGGFAGPIGITDGALDMRGLVGSAVTVGASGRLEGTGHVGSAINNGVIAPGSGGFGTLTVDGDYTGGGTLEIETVLGGDNSQTDRLVIGGSTSGNTAVSVINRDGLGAQTVEGIKIIDVTGASNGTFALTGDYVFNGEQAIIAGAYSYTLEKNGVSTPTDGDWYLRSQLTDPVVPPDTPIYQPGVPVYEAYSDTLLKLNSLPTWRQRIGMRQWSFKTPGTGIWGRIEVDRQRPEADVTTSLTDTDSDIFALQLGADQVLHDGESSALVAGLTAHYKNADTRVRSLFGNGKVAVSGYGLGATLTWYNAGGLYLDAQAHVSEYDADLRSTILGRLTRGNDGSGHALSIEVGQRIGHGQVSITPQAQLTYSKIRFDRFTDPSDAVVSSDKGESLRARFGVSLDRNFMSGGKSSGGIYGIANVNYELLDGTRTKVSGALLSRRDDRLWGELGFGGSVRFGHLSLYAETSVNSALKNLGDSYSVKGQAGIRIGF